MTAKVAKPAMVTKHGMKLYASSAIDARIDALHKSGQKLQAEMHMLACSVLARIEETNDARIAVALVGKLALAMPEMSRVNALREWFQAHSPVVFGDKDSVSYDKNKSFKLEAAMQKPFWKFKANEGTPYTPIDVQKELERMIQKFTVDSTKTGRDHTAVIMAMKAGFNAAKPIEQAELPQ